MLQAFTNQSVHHLQQTYTTFAAIQAFQAISDNFELAIVQTAHR